MKTLRPFVPAVVALLTGCAPPAINAFEATPASIEIGDSTTLSWRVIDATSISITGLGDVPLASTYLTVTPAATTTYQLVAKNSGGTTLSEQVTVTVMPRLDAAAGTFLDRGTVGTTFAFVLRTLAGAPPAASTDVTLTAPGGGSTVYACPAARQLCLFERPSDAPGGGTYTATAVVDGQARTETFTFDGAARGFTAGSIFASQTTSSTVSASWGPAPGAVSYRVQLVDSSGAAKGPAQIVTGTSATATATSAILATDRIQVDASALDLTGDSVALPLAKPHIARATAALGGNASLWRLFGPEAYSGNTLTASFSAVTPAERLAVIVLNADGTDPQVGQNNVTLGVSGTLALPAPPSRPRWSPPLRFDESPRALAARGEDEVRAEEEARMEATPLEQLLAARAAAPRVGVAPPPAPPTRDFCIRDRDTGRFVRATATLQTPAGGEAAHVLFYVDDADLGEFTPTLFDQLAQEWEGNPPGTGIYASDTSTFGPESDVDANGKLIVFFSHRVGVGSPSTGVVLGYFYAFDTMMAKDTTAGCTGNASNGADMFYMNTISNIHAAIPTADVIGTTYPATLAHELQHLINVNAHCVVRTCTALEDRWLNEGLSMAAEDVNGFGWVTDPIYGRMYLDREPGPFPLSYDGRSLTTWEDDPIGNYEAAHALLLFWMDRYGAPILRHLVEGGLTGIDRTQAVLGAPWARQLAEWTSALMFSNETFNPAPDLAYSGPDRTPLHTKITYVNYVPLNPSGASGAVRRDGWNAFATGVGTGSDVTVQVTSADAVKPHVVIVRFAGALPQCPTGAPQADGACHYQ